MSSTKAEHDVDVRPAPPPPGAPTWHDRPWMTDGIEVIDDIEIIDDIQVIDDIEIIEEAEVAPVVAPARVAGSSRWKRRTYVLAFAVIVLSAGLVRALALPAALPYTSYIDEGFVLRPAAHMVADRTWDPGWYNYPSLLIELTAAGTAAYDVVGDDVRSGAEATDASADYNVTSPAELVVIGRLLVWLFAVGTVVVTLLLGTRLLGRRGGLVAGAIVALLPALVSRSAIVIVDTPATFFVMASILAATYLTTTRRPVAISVLSGALAGLAAASKYPAAAILVVPLVVIVTLPTTVRRRIVLAAASVAAAGLAAVVAMPALVLRTSQIIAAIKRQSSIYATKASATSYFDELVRPVEVGPWLLAPAVIGLVVLVVRRRSRVVTLGWLAFFAATALVVAQSAFQPFRNVLPLVPFIAIAVAATIVEGARLIAGRRPDPERGAPRRLLGDALIVLVVAALGLVLVNGGVRPYVEKANAAADSRVQAVDWLAANVQPDQRVFVASEVAVSEEELERIPGEVVVAPSLDGAKVLPIDVASYDVVVTAQFKDLEPVSPAPPPPDVVFGRKRTAAVPKEWQGVELLIEIRLTTPRRA